MESVHSQVSTEQPNPIATIAGNRELSFCLSLRTQIIYSCCVAECSCDLCVVDVDEKQKEEASNASVVPEGIEEISMSTQDSPVKDSPDSPIPDTIKEDHLDVSETCTESQDISQGEEKHPKTETEVNSTEVPDTKPPTSSSSQITLPVSEEVEPVAMDMEEVGSERRKEESIDRPLRRPPQTEMPTDTDDRMGESDYDEDEEEQGIEESLEESLNKDGCQEDDVQCRNEMDMKPELVLDETSNNSQGDGSSSGFLGSPAEADSQMMSMDLMMPAGRTRSDSLLTETEDSLPFDPLKPDGEKVKRRGSPGRSRVKQVGVKC